jgi:MFS family permease
VLYNVSDSTLFVSIVAPDRYMDAVADLRQPGAVVHRRCLLYTAPLVLWPLAHGAMPLVLAMLFAAEFVSGFGLMMLDITIGVIFAAIIPDTLRSRVTGAFQAVNYGSRPLGALLGGLLGSVVGLRPALWVATLGGVAGFALLLPTPLPRYRLPAVDGPARA